MSAPLAFPQKRKSRKAASNKIKKGIKRGLSHRDRVREPSLFRAYYKKGGGFTFYQLTEAGPQPCQQLLGGKPTVGYVDIAELEALAPSLGFAPSTVQQCREEMRYFHSSVEVYDAYSFGTIKRTTGDENGADCIAIYLKKDLLMVVDIRDSDGSTQQAFKAALVRFPPRSLTIGKLVFAFLDAMIEGDGKILEDKEFALSEGEEQILCNRADDSFIAFLLAERRRLLLWRNYYAQLIDTGKALEEDENSLFTPSDLRYFKIFTDKAERLEGSVRALYEQLIQLREAYQAMLDLRLDSVMKIFTVLSALFLPLTLITSWYGMNFKSMPELSWRYGYLFVTVLCFAVAILLIIFFKKRKFM